MSCFAGKPHTHWFTQIDYVVETDMLYYNITCCLVYWFLCRSYIIYKVIEISKRCSAFAHVFLQYCTILWALELLFLKGGTVFASMLKNAVQSCDFITWLFWKYLKWYVVKTLYVSYKCHFLTYLAKNLMQINFCLYLHTNDNFSIFKGVLT